VSETPRQPGQIPSEFYEQLCHCAGIAIFATDPHMRIVAWNSAAAALLGLTAEQVMGRHLASTLPANRRELAEEMMTRALKDHVISQFEIAQVGRANPLHLGITVSPILSKTGECLGASACIRDITRRVELEKQVKDNEKMASLGSMAGGVAHHFNNILGGVTTAVDYALQSDDPSIVRRALRITADAAHRASKLTHDLLAFAEGDRRPDELGDLTETVLAFVDHLEPSLRDRTIDLALDLNPVPVCEVPRQRLMTVLENLANNAVEAMPAGGQLALSLWTEGDEIALEVADSGCGIDETTQQHVFEPFFTTKESVRSDGTKDSGLGLAVVHGLVRDMGGTIALHSRSGEGTQVELRFPIHRIKRPLQEAPPQ